jgi:hypothetical protein
VSAVQADTGYPCRVFTHEPVRPSRPSRGPVLGRFLLTLSAACSIVLAAALVAPAGAAVPQDWEKPPSVSVLDFLLVLVIIPLGLAAVLTFLTVLPSLARDRGYQPGQEWRSESEWFGGPTKGVESAAAVTPEQIESRSKDTGGTSAGW